MVGTFLGLAGLLLVFGLYIWGIHVVRKRTDRTDTEK